jgi:glyoxylase-like metal-dependent hydrolase (beta-lactamase superfamily II)
MIELSRRNALAAGAAAVAAPAIGVNVMTRPAEAQAAAPGQAPGFYRYKVGDITVTAINDGFFSRPVEGFIRNAELPAVQKALSEAFLPTNAVPISFTSLVVQSGNRVMLLDAGNGNLGAPTSGTWMTNFRAAGFDPAQVNAVIISHFHGDHINGLRLRDGTAVFPNAEIHVPAPEWDFWMSDERMAQAPDAARGGFQNCRRVFQPIAAQVKRFAPGAEVATGITSAAAFGHTPGHCIFTIASGTTKLIYMADVTNHPALFVRHPDWSAVFDQDADMARATRHRLLDMAATERAQVHFYHAPFPGTGFISKEASGYDLVPVQWSSAV